MLKQNFQSLIVTLLLQFAWAHIPLPRGQHIAYRGGPWRFAHATFYGSDDAQATMGGACGYGNLWQSGYGTNTAALSSVMFRNGYGCGGCYEIKCVSSKWCYSGNPAIVVTATNLCPPNWAKPSNYGGWCNPPREHFDMSKPAFMHIAEWVAGIVPVLYRRVPCAKRGDINFTLLGNPYWILVYVSNVGGSGDLLSLSIKGSRTGWMPMTRTWGAAFQIFHRLQGQSISFMATSLTTHQTIIAWNVAPREWKLGQTYSGGQFH
ncbi:hypothetical protein O6H91_15G022100 [Diphasiastrum complanatum]|uniref:Uncharacterized protein n=4 Tax=Diphasiastrum complanatum TaxID=34168 RepID=A0ACC2BGI4_DIPCM|nr:hypothetical protein O6H91_15G021500 [Diphasiastrum complanatum]KAJ7528816.1 hypothetical protein O6H91_15G021500 [Diphasiastrum complanatum]KAJ7528817.1 hypothetical protein O6H91_15G021500 [Diphasiastrum complanatum]KAJ7528833.1 hypothetical protein O6H91_15G022100 [Diphasiastrum complanatum]